MGGRGASSGGGKLSAEIRGVLGKRKNQSGDAFDRARDAAHEVNPNHGKNGNTYTHNCQRCVYAFEERMRGYDVEAGGYEGRNDVMFENGRWMKMYDGQKWERNLGKRCDAVYKTIKERVGDWGEGARGVIYVAWKSGQAHVFNVINYDGHVLGVDAQTGSMSAQLLDAYIHRAKPSMTMLSRVDNLTETDNFKYAVSKRGKK